MIDCLDLARRPTNHRLIDLRILSQAKMKAPVILGGEAGSSRDILHLPLTIPVQCDLRADRAAVAGGTLKVKFNPLILGRNRILLYQQGTILIGDHSVKHATIPQISQRDRTAIIGVGNADGLSDINELSGAIIQPDTLVLISR
jgi:hypothetical protein